LHHSDHGHALAQGFAGRQAGRGRKRERERERVTGGARDTMRQSRMLRACAVKSSG